MRNLIAIALLIASHLPTKAAEEVLIVSSVNTATLIDTCRQATAMGHPLRMDCSGYILGVFDQMSFSGVICPPHNMDGGPAQTVAVALKALNNDPENWHRAPVYLIGQSFKAAFPCGKGRD